ncbi:MAG: hypothetical protein OHK0013_18830 [Sandaracinaceae bacterium]
MTSRARWRRLTIASALTLAAIGCDGGSTPPATDAGPVPDAYVPPGVDASLDATMSMTGNDTGSTGPTSPLVDPTCLDGMYRESLPDRSASLDDLIAGYSSANAEAFVQGVLERRYPHGWTLVREGRMGFIDCVMAFLSDRSSAQRVIGQLGTVVHECGHVYDLDLSMGRDNSYSLRADLTMTASGGDTTARGGMTFARSLIRNDAYQAMRAPCPMGSFRGCDGYANIYLDGDPTDGTFDSGDQGFNLLIEEVVQYVSSLAVGYAFADTRAPGSAVSDRDGMLTFLWYMTRYLRMARLEYPSAYEHLVHGDGGRWRELILTVWGRAWLYLEATADLPGLGIDDDALMPLATAPELVEEIERLRTAQGCP